MPVLSLRLHRSVMSGVSAAVSSSSSSFAFKSPSLPITSSPKLFHRLFFKSNLTFPINSSIRCFASTSSTTVDKVKVQNPIVEMDGSFFIQSFGGNNSLNLLFVVLNCLFIMLRWWNDEDHLENDQRQGLEIFFRHHLILLYIDYFAMFMFVFFLLLLHHSWYFPTWNWT